MQVLSFFPNETEYTMRLPDRFTRYKFSLSARTQVGSGEAYAEESPHFANEGELLHIQHMLYVLVWNEKSLLLMPVNLGRYFS